MTQPIEDYAVIGDGHTAALVGRNGSIDWLSTPRFDAAACFAALLGTPEHGHWQIAPTSASGDQPVRAVRRRYREGTLVLETDFETDTGAIRLIDFMPIENQRMDIVRIVEGLRGTVSMTMELVIRFDYGSAVPWVRRVDHAVLATAGPDTLELHTPIETRGEDMKTVGEFEVRAGERVPFQLNYQPSHLPLASSIDVEAALKDTDTWWRRWSSQCRNPGPWNEAVQRSLITLKALIYEPTGGIVAAVTTSLPEQAGGSRNWDYRYCWLRDATFTLGALISAGYTDEAAAWREWLLRAVAGAPADLQMLYSVTGERRLTELELPWLPGYGGATPVRIGNAASKQFQLDVYGEVMDTLHLARMAGLPPQPHAWRIQRTILDFLSVHWRDPDEGIWEVRGPRRHFVHSKVMAWVAFDRAVKEVELFQLDGPVDEWRRTRDEIHAQVCERGFDTTKNAFVQHYGSPELDASLLLVPRVGFLPGSDPRVRGTVEAIQRELAVDGAPAEQHPDATLLLRYATESGVDNLPPGEGAFLPCAFWLADALALTGRTVEARKQFEALLHLANDVGLYSEEVDPRSGHMLGNFPQALTHMALINTAHLLVAIENAAKK
ncbi:MAG: glycoside hydrolase family 15 protein [Pseudomonadota bacterium]|nr:glycoside hydrolase family 15 protein [Pseudomonadota bacterium]